MHQIVCIVVDFDITDIDIDIHKITPRQSKGSMFETGNCFNGTINVGAKG